MTVAYELKPNEISMYADTSVASQGPTKSSNFYDGIHNIAKTLIAEQCSE